VVLDGALRKQEQDLPLPATDEGSGGHGITGAAALVTPPRRLCSLVLHAHVAHARSGAEVD